MKCVCGYEYLTNFNWDKPNHPLEVVKGDKEFIEINGHFTRTTDDYYPHLEEVSLFACPKCNNIIMD